MIVKQRVECRMKRGPVPCKKREIKALPPRKEQPVPSDATERSS